MRSASAGGEAEPSRRSYRLSGRGARYEKRPTIVPCLANGGSDVQAGILALDLRPKWSLRSVKKKLAQETRETDVGGVDVPEIAGDWPA